MTAAFKIGGDEFPIPSTFTLSDGPLVYEAAGLEFAEFAERMDSIENSTDIRALTALVAIAVSRARPQWTRRQVVQYLGKVDLDEFRIEGDDADGPPAVPPETAAAKPSQSSSTASTTSPEATSGAPV